MKRSERRLLDVFRRLPDAEADMLVGFAQFLAQRAGASAAEIAEPKSIPRPANESVVAALKRLSESYPMLDKAKMLNDTSMLVAEHVMTGREAAEVIDELELVFRRHYEALTREDS
ncbi:MAG: Crp/Fnr family transcriptional regulator [Thiotrichales bacterium SG8_50]|nr:MAG: Crp/Fnr family transcriptional regulator [Thiotrichales bacterium SG8_50]